MHLKMLSGKWRPFCLGLNVLTGLTVGQIMHSQRTFELTRTQQWTHHTSSMRERYGVSWGMECCLWVSWIKWIISQDVQLYQYDIYICIYICYFSLKYLWKSIINFQLWIPLKWRDISVCLAQHWHILYVYGVYISYLMTSFASKFMINMTWPESVMSFSETLNMVRDNKRFCISTGLILHFVPKLHRQGYSWCGAVMRKLAKKGVGADGLAPTHGLFH